MNSVQFRRLVREVAKKVISEGEYNPNVIKGERQDQFAMLFRKNLNKKKTNELIQFIFSKLSDDEQAKLYDLCYEATLI